MNTLIDLDDILLPIFKKALAPSSIPCIIEGIPAITKTFSILNPGALVTGFSTNSAPLGNNVIFKRASLSSPSL